MPRTDGALDLFGPNWRLRTGRRAMGDGRRQKGAENCSACDGGYLCDGLGRRNVSPLSLGAMPDTNLVLVIDDEPQIRRAVRDALRDVAARVDEAADGAAGVAAATEHRPDLIVLDLGLPDVPGVEVCRQIRRRSAVPIIVLSARHSEHEKVDLLNAGADDYVTKPFSVLELAARARAQIRRARTFASSSASATPISIGGLLVDTVHRRVTRSGAQIHLTPIEWQILATLLGSAGRTLTHQQIFDAVWDREFGSPQQYLRVHITNLRRKIETDPAAPQIIITEPGVGYRVELPR